MANKRMFSLDVIDTDLFLNMPQSTQNLYFHLGMRADDDGFVSNPKTILRVIGASEDDFKLLLMKNYIIPFESGICVITHWKINNYIRSDRHTQTQYTIEKQTLIELENKEYSSLNNECLPSGIPNVSQVVDADKISIDKISIDKISIDNTEIGTSKTKKHKYGEYKNVLLSDDELEKLKNQFTDWESKIETLSVGIETYGYKYKSHYLAILNWAKSDKKTSNTKSDIYIKPGCQNNFKQEMPDLDKITAELIKKQGG